MSRPGTADLGIIFPIAAEVTLSPSSQWFGSVPVEGSASRDVHGEQHDGQHVHGTLSFTPAGDFLLGTGTCGGFNVSVPAGSSCTFQVAFSPAAVGTRSGAPC